ncbi:MAG: hypothetical protein HY901_35115 [Deltaproteobacteria bacterium]|nr:hypothetical protein [Deltaproteobacteria bacterium]
MRTAKARKTHRATASASGPAPEVAPVSVPEQAPPKGWLKRASEAVLDKGASASSFLTEELLRTARASLYLTSHTIEGQFLPVFNSLSEMRQDIETSWLDAVAGRKSWFNHAQELGDRLVAGSRYQSLVGELGKQLFGSAVYAGEQVLAKNDVYRLSYLPPKKGVAVSEASLFFVAGFIPYGDRLFRFLPEASLYERYLERGIPVYLMELVGDRQEMTGLGRVTVERQIDWIDEMAQVAFRHNGERKMVAQGYCGSGLQLLSYLAARPRDADAKFKLATLFVTPVDAKRCNIFAEMVSNMPRSLLWSAWQRSQLMGGYVRGAEMWAGLDTSLKNVFAKTPMGRFASGWKKPAWSKVKSVSDLNPLQRFELAGAYWISVDNAERFPIPVELVRAAIHAYDRGVGDDGMLGISYKGRPVTLRSIAEESQLRLTAFYAGQDKLVQEETGHVLMKLLGPRYRQLTHPTAAHVTYVCFPAQWDKAHPKAFLPNPIDVILEDYARA